MGTVFAPTSPPRNRSARSPESAPSAFMPAETSAVSSSRDRGADGAKSWMSMSCAPSVTLAVFSSPTTSRPAASSAAFPTPACRSTATPVSGPWAARCTSGGLLDRRARPDRADVRRPGSRDVDDRVDDAADEGRTDGLRDSRHGPVPRDAHVGHDRRVGRLPYLPLQRADHVGFVGDAPRGDPCLRNVDFEDVGGVAESSVDVVEVDVERGRSRHVTMNPRVSERDARNDETQPARIRVRWARLARSQGVQEIEFPLWIRVEAHVERIDRDARQVDHQRGPSPQQRRASDCERRDPDACSPYGEHLVSGGIVDRCIRTREPEKPDAPDVPDPRAPLERSAEQAVDLIDQEPSRPRRVHVDEHTGDGRQDEQQDRAEGDASASQRPHAQAPRPRRARDRRKPERPRMAGVRGRHQYACPIPIAMASGTPRIVGCIPLTGLALAASVSFLKPRIWRGWMR